MPLEGSFRAKLPKFLVPDSRRPKHDPVFFKMLEVKIVTKREEN